jgi:uncharacterized membrane protein YtjA (UPF0391 family)
LLFVFAIVRLPACVTDQSSRDLRVPAGQELYASAAVASTKRRRAAPHQGASAMLGWALTFLVVALIAAVLGFGGIAGLSIEIAKIIFFVAVVLFLISAIIGLVRGRSPTVP